MSYPAVKRILDIVISILGLLVLSPLFAIIAIAIVAGSPGGFLYRQTRIGKGGKPFQLYKFRSMKAESDRSGLLTIGNDRRITRLGKFIRSFKLDELPQLVNVLKGEMSLVGPRPEVADYVEKYNEKQRKVLEVRPGITDLASIKYFDENKLLGESDNPESTYLEKIMPDKLELNIQYIRNMSFQTDLKIIYRTLLRILKK